MATLGFGNLSCIDSGTQGSTGERSSFTAPRELASMLQSSRSVTKSQSMKLRCIETSVQVVRFANAEALGLLDAPKHLEDGRHSVDEYQHTTSSDFLLGHDCHIATDIVVSNTVSCQARYNLESIRGM